MASFVFLALYGLGAWAEDGIVDAAETGHEHVTHVPWGQVGVQAFNLLALVALLVYLLRQTIKAHFAHRAKEYGELVQRAESARKEAERGKQEIEARLKQLTANADQQLREASEEGQRQRDRLSAEAQALAQKLAQEAQRTAAVELDNAKAELRTEVLRRALETSSTNLEKHLGLTEQKNLQNEFADKIRVVGG